MRLIESKRANASNNQDWLGRGWGDPCLLLGTYKLIIVLTIDDDDIALISFFFHYLFFILRLRHIFAATIRTAKYNSTLELCIARIALKLKIYVPLNDWHCSKMDSSVEELNLFQILLEISSRLGYFESHTLSDELLPH